MGEDLTARIVLFVVMLGAGVLLIWMARAAAAGRLGRNQVAGIRTARTMASEEAWLAAHVRAERPTVYAGVAAIASALLALLPVSLAVVGAGVGAGCLVMLVLVLYGAYVGGRAAAAVSDTSRD